jgi:hypothetical protein
MVPVEVKYKPTLSPVLTSTGVGGVYVLAPGAVVGVISSDTHFTMPALSTTTNLNGFEFVA